ncbi:MAG: hypothetical protein ACOYL6_03365 [Bacteriovoracaceae bacterium]
MLGKKDVLFYYGLETPPLSTTLGLSDSYIILQDYHPLVQQGVFAEYFPLADRYLYWNSCKVPKSLCHLPPEEIVFAEYQAEWDCYILDLKRPMHREILILKAIELMSHFGVQGLFVDDLDVWSDNPQRQKILLNFLDELETRLPQNFSYIFNRGFPFWSKKSDKLKAVLIEDVGPSSALRLSQGAHDWLYNTLKIQVPLLLHKAPHVSILFLEYESDISSIDFIQSIEADSPLGVLFDSYTSNESIAVLTSVGRKLDLWPSRFYAVPASPVFLNS